MSGASRIKSQLTRENLPPGQQGEFLQYTASGRQGFGWKDIWPTIMARLFGTHPGSLSPERATDWISIGQPGDAIQYANDYANVAGTQTPRYRVDALGVIHIEGAVSKPTDTGIFGSVIFTMPAGLRMLGTLAPRFDCFVVTPAGGSRSAAPAVLGATHATFPGAIYYGLPQLTPLGFARLDLQISYLVEA